MMVDYGIYEGLAEACHVTKDATTAPTIPIDFTPMTGVVMEPVPRQWTGR
jgi:hypothetical protein